MSEHQPKFAPGATVTRKASVAVTGRQLLTITGDGTVGPTTGAGSVLEGVAGNDAGVNGLVTVYTGGTQLLVAAAAIAAGARVQPAAAGQVATFAAAAAGAVSTDINVIGHAVAAIAAGAAGEVRLYH